MPMLLSLSCLLLAQPNLEAFSAEKFVQHARSLKGLPYEFGGRLRKPSGGIDCQGVLFYAAERSGECGWKSYSVYPTKSVEHQELGAPVLGLDPVSEEKLDVTLLKTGDILWFVDFPSNPAEPSIGKLEGQPVWVWHTGVYSGQGKFIVGDHFAQAVVEVELLPYLREHYAGIFVTRMNSGPKPVRCRKHQPMKK